MTAKAREYDDPLSSGLDVNTWHPEKVECEIPRCVMLRTSFQREYPTSK